MSGRYGHGLRFLGQLERQCRQQGVSCIDSVIELLGGQTESAEAIMAGVAAVIARKLFRQLHQLQPDLGSVYYVYGPVPGLKITLKEAADFVQAQQGWDIVKPSVAIQAAVGADLASYRVLDLSHNQGNYYHAWMPRFGSPPNTRHVDMNEHLAANDVILVRG